ncbi:MAG TPA: KamA family protein [Bacteroidales bacterium]|jgi:lysine 2,3-aminomutase|nr:KamA family protein [Bacteroidales bacterium]MDD4087291.1 KamA family protein [Bacteroidales bacterium]MDY0086144.1 KamA family protein [Bacteroidales bacterium]HPE43659.1 KamA family protein [Bacteroidales bacterium]
MNSRSKQKFKKLDKIAINVKSHRILQQFSKENPDIVSLLREANDKEEALEAMRQWIMPYFENNKTAWDYYNGKISGREAFDQLSWPDYGAIRLMDYIQHAGRIFEDLNLGGDLVGSHPVKYLWLAIKYGTGGANHHFFYDTLLLFRQIKGTYVRQMPDNTMLKQWMDRHPSGLDEKVIKIRKHNRDRILKVIIQKMDAGELSSRRYQFEPGMTFEQKFLTATRWWDDTNFHLKFAVRSPKMLNELLNNSLSTKTMELLNEARQAGIPFFVNPYYLSLLNVAEPEFAVGSDLAIRDYVIYSKQLIKEFGKIVAWEMEDIIEPGKPNAAGWILPTVHNLHRRYPEVAIMIPDTVGRACGGLCVSCQRMYDFQSGHLNFNLDKLKPKETWPQKLQKLMDYFEEDTQLRDILITGGDALMSSDKSLQTILNAVYEMAKRKMESNQNLPEDKKIAPITRVRLGTRLPVFLPQRITNELVAILADFKKKASEIGIRQFVIQTHFESAMEVTPEVKNAIEMLLSAGWIITNQLVFTAAASRRGHTAKLRKVLNDIGVLTYYTFSVKGYKENSHNFATNERAVQEQLEEKEFGRIDKRYNEKISSFAQNAEEMVSNIKALREEAGIPFLATDRNVLNLPGVGKSLTFRTIGLSRHGRRILEFDHDDTRRHSPIIHEMGKVVIIESKSLNEYLNQLEDMGEDKAEYHSIFGYSIGETEPLQHIYQYPAYDFEVTDEYTNLELSETFMDMAD